MPRLDNNQVLNPEVHVNTLIHTLIDLTKRVIIQLEALNESVDALREDVRRNGQHLDNIRHTGLP